SGMRAPGKAHLRPAKIPTIVIVTGSSIKTRILATYPSASAPIPVVRLIEILSRIPNPRDAHHERGKFLDVDLKAQPPHDPLEVGATLPSHPGHFGDQHPLPFTNGRGIRKARIRQAPCSLPVGQQLYRLARVGLAREQVIRAAVDPSP